MKLKQLLAEVSVPDAFVEDRNGKRLDFWFASPNIINFADEASDPMNRKVIEMYASEEEDEGPVVVIVVE